MSSNAATADLPSGPTSRSLRAFTDALARGRLAHAILVHGEHASALETATLGLAGRLLYTADPLRHPDFFALRPSGKARLVKVDSLRDFNRNLNLTASAGARKVGVVYDADRMNPASSNALLKTLEEPPSGTTLFLITTRPNELLPTIRSRCFHLRLPATSTVLADEGWQSWRTDYATWLERLAASVSSPPSKSATSDLLMAAYGLGARFESVLQKMTDSAWDDAKTRLPENVDEDESAAIQVGIHKGLRSSLLIELEQSTRNFALANPASPNTPVLANRLARAVSDLEKIAGLLEVNIPEAAALEYFLLRSLRHWTAKN